MTLADYRALFDLPPDVAYLDHAATGVLGRHAHAAASDFLDGHAGRVPARSPNDYPADLMLCHSTNGRRLWRFERYSASP